MRGPQDPRWRGVGGSAGDETAHDRVVVACNLLTPEQLSRAPVARVARVVFAVRVPFDAVDLRGLVGSCATCLSRNGTTDGSQARTERDGLDAFRRVKEDGHLEISWSLRGFFEPHSADIRVRLFIFAPNKMDSIQCRHWRQRLNCRLSNFVVGRANDDIVAKKR